MFCSLDELVQAARAHGPVEVAVVAAHDPDVIGALMQARDAGLAEATLIGNLDKIRPLTDSAGWAIPPERLVEEKNEAEAARKAIAMVREGRAGLLMKGKLATSTLIRAVLDKDAGLRAGRLLSQVIVFEVPGFNRLMLMSDAAINIGPSLEQKAGICRNAIEVAHAIGIPEPKIALLCAIEFVNPEMPATVDAAALTLMNRRGQISGAYLEGPIALDVPLSRFAAERKAISSPLTEATDIFIAPGIDAANILYRAILYFARGESCGIVIGAKAPLVLLSRAETPATKLRSIALGILVGAAAADRAGAAA
jgi:phosphate butyryltransferase